MSQFDEVLLQPAATTSDAAAQGETRAWVVPVDQTTQAILGIHWQNGTLDLTLMDPGDAPIDPRTERRPKAGIP